MKKPELLIIGIDGATPSYIKEGVEKGRLPAFAKLMKQGVFFNDCMSSFPSITPTCWSTISTGAVPSVHGALDVTMHVPGTHPEEVLCTYSSLNVNAERFWESAAKIGKKALMICVPCSGPARSELVMQVLGGHSVRPDKAPSEDYSSGVPAQVFRINNDDEKYNEVVKLQGGGEWIKSKNSDCLYRKIDEKTYVFDVKYNKNNVLGEVENFSWTIIVENDGIKIGADKEEAEKCPVIPENSWSPLLKRELMTDDGKKTPFRFRARVSLFDAKNKAYVVSVTRCMNYKKEITPLKLAEEINQIEQINADIAGVLWEDPELVEKYLEVREWSIDWQQQVIRHCVENYDNDIIFDYVGFPDSINHRFRSSYEMVDEPEIHDTACFALEKTYDIVNKHIQWLLDNVADENTTIAIVSDHGAVGFNEFIRVGVILEKAGLITYIDSDGDKSSRNKNVDWSKTKAYPVASCHINVNLKGREPVGVVEPEDYDKTVYEIIRALHNGCETKDQEINGLAFAVEKKQAGFIGLGGENCGDVVFGLSGSRLGGVSGGVHAEQIPSARSKTGDIRCLCMMSGKAFKENIQLERPADISDFAPTLCYAMGYPQPKDATGGVVFQALK